MHTARVALRKLPQPSQQRELMPAAVRVPGALQVAVQMPALRTLQIAHSNCVLPPPLAMPALRELSVRSARSGCSDLLRLLRRVRGAQQLQVSAAAASDQGWRGGGCARCSSDCLMVPAARVVFPCAYPWAAGCNLQAFHGMASTPAPPSGV
jgi:hypothetical protein